MTASTDWKRPPPLNYSSRGAIKCRGMDVGRDVYLLPGSGTPVDGTSGTGAGFAGPGSIYIDTTTPKIYLNGNTKLSPTWKLVTSAA